MNAQAFMRTSSKIRPCDTARAPLLPAHRRSPAAYLGRRLPGRSRTASSGRSRTASGALSDPPGTMDSGALAMPDLRRTAETLPIPSVR
nr:hypothetical protein GCM10025732_08240 [Glycomyces mayteni]